MSEKNKQCSDDAQWCEHSSQRHSKNRTLSPFDPEWCPDAFKVEILERTEAGVIDEIADRLLLEKDQMWRIINLICDERQKEWDWLTDFLVRQEVRSDLLKQSRAKPDVARNNCLKFWNDRCKKDCKY